MHTRFLCYKDRLLHISVIHAVLSAGSLWSVAYGSAGCKGNYRNGQIGFIPGLPGPLLTQVLPVRSNAHQRAEFIASVNAGHHTGPICQIKRLSQPMTPDQNFLSLVFEANSKESKQFDKNSKQENNKVEITSPATQTENAEHCKDFALEQEIRECFLRLQCMCTARAPSHLAFMMRDFRAGLHRSNINSMFFTRYTIICNFFEPSSESLAKSVSVLLNCNGVSQVLI